MGWLSATGRYLGIVTCSALLLISATLGQTGQASPARSFSPEAFAATGSQAGQTAQSDTESAESSGVETGDAPASTPVPSATEAAVAPSPTPAPLHADENITEQTALRPGGATPRAGTGLFVPDDEGVRFNKASPVRMAPVRIQIPQAWVDAPVVTVGVTPDGEMEAPSGFWDVGWYRNGTRPGDPGKAVMAGHFDSQEGAAVFYFLGDLQPGDDIRILLGGPDGERFYKVREVATYNVDDAPLEKIFGPSDKQELVLITCGGEWRGPEAGYSDRIVVYADMVVPGAPEPGQDGSPATG